MDRLGIELLTVFGLPPVEFVNLAADLGCRHISTMLTARPESSLGYPPYSLAEDKAMRRDMISAMKDRGVSISLGEGFLVRPGEDIRRSAPDLEIMHELGVTRVNTVSMDRDRGRTFDQFAVMAQMAAEAGMVTTLEFAPGLGVPDLPTALEAVRHVGRDDFRLLIDTMHLGRTGGGPADLAALDPALIGYVQLCDVPLVSKFEHYMQEGMYERLPPSEGELPLLDILRAVPRDVIVGLEVPELEKARRGEDHHQRVGRCVAAAHALLAQL